MTILKIKITIVRMLFVLARGSAHQERNRTSDFTRNEGIQMEKKKTEPKYLRIVEWIKKQVADGVLNVGDRLASENELSAQFGLSRQTVRQATSILENSGILERRRGSGTYVSSTCVVQRAATMNIGVVTTYLDDYLFPCIIRGIDGVLTEHGYTMQLSITYNKVENERNILEALLVKGIDGLIIEPTKSGLPNLNADLYRQIKRQGIPCLFINAGYPGQSFPVVAMDDYACGRSAAAYLLKNGHRRIGGIFKSDDNQGHLRYAGFAGELTRHKLPLQEGSIAWYTTEDLEIGPEERQTWEQSILKRMRDCSAVLCYNDQMAVRIMEAAERAGRRVPEDLSILSFDDSYLATLGWRGLTTFVHPKEELGAAAAEALLKFVNHEEIPAETLFPPQLKERDTVRSMK